MAQVFMRFPGGKAKALTLSYDDGVEQDIRLVEIMKQNGLKGTFNLNSGLYAPEGTVYPKGQIHRRMSRRGCQELFGNSGMEVAVHGYTHPHLEQLPVNACTLDVIKDRETLEEEFGCIVRGMAYPFGTYSDAVVESLKQCGIAYSRTVESTGRFDIPKDWLRMPATCHHNDPRLMELAHKLVERTVKNEPQLFYLWGHSYEFEADNNWQVIEEFAEYMGNREDFWYASNIEVYDYVKGYEQLQFSANCKMVHNPTAELLYFVNDAIEYCVKPGETITCGI